MDVLLCSPQRTATHLSFLDLPFSPEDLVWNSRALVNFEGFKYLETLEMQYLAQCEPRQFYMAWSPTSLSLLCPEHLDLLLPGCPG